MRGGALFLDNGAEPEFSRDLEESAVYIFKEVCCGWRLRSIFDIIISLVFHWSCPWSECGRAELGIVHSSLIYLCSLATLIAHTPNAVKRTQKQREYNYLNLGSQLLCNISLRGINVRSSWAIE